MWRNDPEQRAKYFKEYYQRNKDRILSKLKDEYHKDPRKFLDQRKKYGTKSRKHMKKYRLSAKGIYRRTKSRAKVCKLPFQLDQHSFINWYDSQPKICVYCGVLEENLSKLKSTIGTRRDVMRLTIDRVENSLGYILINLCLSCFLCNSIKRDIFTHEEMKEIGQKFIKFKYENSGV